MKTLPKLARLYVGGVIGLGAALLAYYFPVLSFANPGRLWLFGLLLFLSAITSIFKVNLPLTRSGSTMSVSYAVDFASLLLLGPHNTMIVAAGSAFSQCHLNSKERNPFIARSSASRRSSSRFRRRAWRSICSADRRICR